jgi:hypothetical protein
MSGLPNKSMKQTAPRVFKGGHRPQRVIIDSGAAAYAQRSTNERGGTTLP